MYEFNKLTPTMRRENVEFGGFQHKLASGKRLLRLRFDNKNCGSRHFYQRTVKLRGSLRNHSARYGACQRWFKPNERAPRPGVLVEQGA